jgi:hypothetical protein
MPKILLLLAGLLLLGMPDARAQNEAQRKAMQSDYVKKAAACMKQLANAGRAEGVETLWEGGDILLRDPDKEDELGEMLGTMFDCLKEAFGRDKELIDRLPDQGVKGTKSWVWYGKAESYFVWCASDGTSSPESPGTMGGNSSKRNWYAIAFQCSVSEQVLNWYTPTGALPVEPIIKPVRFIVPEVPPVLNMKFSRASYSDCMQSLAKSGRQLNLNTILIDVEVAVMAPSEDELLPLWKEMESCLDANFAQQRTGTGFGRASYEYRQWFTETNGRYEWCTKDLPLIGFNERMHEHVVWVRCGKSSPKLPNGMFY